MAQLDKPDLLIIGGGTAGLAAAFEARRLGASVTLIDRGAPEGSGRIATLAARALSAAAAHAEAMRNAPGFGISAEEPRIHHRRVQQHVAEVLAEMAPDDAPARLAALGIEHVIAEARFADRNTVLAADRAFRPRRVIIATGSQPVLPRVPGLADIPFFTPETIVHNSRKLTHLLIIGGGGMALELAQAHRRLRSDVTVVAPEGLLDGQDPELADLLLRYLGAQGIALHPHAAITAIRPRSQGIGVLARAGEGPELAFDVSHVLVAAARQPELDALDLQKAGLLRGEGKPLVPRDGVRTSNRRVFVVGDAAIAGAPCGSLAAAQGRAVARHAVLGTRLDSTASRGPRLVNTDPALVEIGLSEREAAKIRGLQVLRAPTGDTTLARAERQPPGLVKLIADGAGRVLGAGLVAPRAGEVAALVSLAIAARLSLRELATLLPAFPSLAEAVQRLALDAEAQRRPGALEQRLAALRRHLP